MPAKKMKKQSKPKDLDINIKINNLERAIRAGSKCHKKNRWKSEGSGCWIFGSALAIVLSYTKNSSILWAVIHGIVSWFYVIYRIIMLYV